MRNLEEHILYTLALSYVPGIGNAGLRKLLTENVSAKTIWELTHKEKNSINGLNSLIVESIGQDKYLDQAKQELKIGESRGIKALHIDDKGYPALLRNCANAPYILFSRGEIQWQHKKHIAIVGTRKMSMRSKEFLRELITACEGLSISINSGLALGVDAEAHRAALENNLQTIAVVAHGLDRIFPKTNLPLAREILHQGGVISEFSTFHAPERENFKRRNRLIAGISHVTVIIESDYKGGAMSTAAFANQYQRTVFAVPGRPNDISQRGCNKLIKNQQAYMLTEPGDILQYLDLEANPSQKSLQAQIPLDFSEAESEIYDYLFSQGKMHIDDLALAIQKPSYQVLPLLLQLQMKNAVRAFGGRYFEAL